MTKSLQSSGKGGFQEGTNKWQTDIMTYRLDLPRGRFSEICQHIWPLAQETTEHQLTLKQIRLWYLSNLWILWVICYYCQSLHWQLKTICTRICLENKLFLRSFGFWKIDLIITKTAAENKKNICMYICLPGHQVFG